MDERKRGVVIAIDGPAGAGKSTLARRVAGEVDLPYINTGLMYRALAARSLARGVDPEDGRSLALLARDLRSDMTAPPHSELVIGVSESDPPLLSDEVESIVSTVARHPEVREVMRARQRTLGAGGSVVEGRDIGTVVFPDADVKIFLSAHADVRAERREQERGGGSSVGQGVARRDALDARTNPLAPASDAVVIDTTGRSAEETFGQAMRIIRRALGGDPE